MKRDGRDDNLRQRSQRAPQSRGYLVVQGAVPPVPDNEFRQDHRDGQVGVLPVQRLDVVDQRRDERAVGRDDDLKGQGFTVTKKVGNAVARNRTRRRLKEAMRLVLATETLSGVDLVLIGREGTRARAFTALQDDLRRALAKAGKG